LVQSEDWQRFHSSSASREKLDEHLALYAADLISALQTVLALAHPLRMYRVARQHQLADISPGNALLFDCRAYTWAQFPDAFGLLHCWIGQPVGWTGRIIELQAEDHGHAEGDVTTGRNGRSRGMPSISIPN